MNDQTIYTAAIISIIVSIYVGFMIGHREEADICSIHITKLDEEKKEHIQTTNKLTECKAKKAGDCVLNCTSICDKQVKAALEIKKDWACND